MFAPIVIIAGVMIATTAMAREGSHAMPWVGTWAASPQAAARALELRGQTIRQVVKVSVGGTQLRVRLSNAFGASALSIGAARVALRGQGASIVAGSDRMLTFNGASSITIPVGAAAFSDPVKLRVAHRGSLAVSLYIPGAELAATEHTLGLQTTYISPEGDFSGAEVLPIATTTESIYFLTGVDVVTSTPPRAIIALGDSITDGLNSTANAARRWPDRLADRLHGQKGGSRVAVLNAGISGNRLLRDTVGSNASARLDRDALVQSGAKWLIVLIGINDIGFPGAASAEGLIAGHRQVIDRARAMGLKVYGGTLTPFRAFLPGVYYTPEGESTRQAVNHWIRTSNAYDAVIDFDKAIRDPADPAALRKAFDSGDNLHPNDAGYQAMADAVDLALFRDRRSTRGTAKVQPSPAPSASPAAVPCRCPP